MSALTRPDDIPLERQALFERFAIEPSCAHVLIESLVLFVTARLVFGASQPLGLAIGLWCGYCAAFVGVAAVRRRAPKSPEGTSAAIALAVVVGALVGRAVELGLWPAPTQGWFDVALRFALHATFVSTLIVTPIVRSTMAAHRRSQLEEERARLASQLVALQAQIEPHFLFNTLATLRSLIRRDAALASEMLDRITTFLRAVLPDVRRATSTLEREIAIVDSYLAIMRLRLGERLAYSIDAAPETLNAAAPSMLLQPLVENAIKHGIEPSDAGGVVGIRTTAENGALVVEIRNTGEALGALETTDPSRTGLSNVRRRLAALYGGEGTLSLASDPDGATIAILRIPLSPAR